MTRTYPKVLTALNHWRSWLRGGLAGAALVVLSACGGGGGAGSNTAGANGTGTEVVKVPDLQYNVQSAVLQNGIKMVDSGLTGPDASGTFVALDISGYQVGQVFVIGKKAHKITGINPLADGTSGQIFTMPATLNEIYSDLKFNYAIHPVITTS